MLLLLRSKLWRSGNAAAAITGAECAASAGTLTPVATSVFFLGGGGASKVKLAPQRTWHFPEEPKPEPKRKPEQKPKPQPKHEPQPEPVSISATAVLTGACVKASAARLRAETRVSAVLVSACASCQAGDLYGVASAAAMVDEGMEAATSDLMLLELILNL